MFSGSIVALITPFNNDGIDQGALKRLVKWHIEQGTSAIVPCGTTGESPTLSHQEHQMVVELTIAAADGKVPVIAGAGSNNTKEALSLTHHAQEAGADGVLHVAGYYNKPNQEGLYQHFKTLHDNSDIPIVLYNIPPRTIVELTVDTIARLAELPRIVGVKDATMDLNRPMLERLRIGNKFSYLSGEDGTAVAYNAQGGNGCISVTANVAAKLCADVQNACANGDFRKALAIQDRLMPLHQALFAEPNPAGVKYAASLMGLCSSEARLPMVELTKKSQLKIKQALQSLKLIN